MGTAETENFQNLNVLFKKIKDIFTCQICSQIKNEDSIIFFWSCPHFYCTDCLSPGKSCSICLASGEKTNDVQVKLAENENILAIFRKLSRYNFTLKDIKDLEQIPKSVEKVARRKARNTGEITKDVVQKTEEKKSKRKCSVKDQKPERELRNSLKKKADDKSDLKKDVEMVAKTVGNSSNQVVKSENQGKKLNVTKRNHKGETPLHLACRKENMSLIKELIDAGANPNMQDNAGWTPLHDSVAFGRTKVVKFLIENGAKVNTPGFENETALHQAVLVNNTEIARLLLKYGADKNARNIFGETPMDVVKKYNNSQMNDIFLNTPAKLKSQPKMTKDLQTHSKTDIVLYGFDLSESESSVFNNFVDKFQYKTLKTLSPQLNASHIVVSEDGEPKITWGIIPGVLMACEVVSIKWMKDSLDNNKLQAIDKYEMKSEFYSGFLKSRQNQIDQLPGLFSGCHFYFGGNFELYKTKNSTFLKMELKVLVEKNGGVILSRNPDPESLALEKTIPYHADVNGSLAKTSYYIIYCKGIWDPAPKYNMVHMKTLPVEWILASIFKFQLIDPNASQSYLDYV